MQCHGGGCGKADGTISAAGEHDAISAGAGVLGEFLAVEPTETYATVRKRTIGIGRRLAAIRSRWKNGSQGLKSMSEISSK
jgi:hypothetical protein